MMQQRCVCNVSVIICYKNYPSTCRGCTKQQHLTLSAVWDDAKLSHCCIVTSLRCCISIHLPIVHYLIPDKVKLQENYPIVLFLPVVASNSEVSVTVVSIASVQKHVVGSSKVGEGFNTINHWDNKCSSVCVILV